jgi:hypothetical protein
MVRVRLRLCLTGVLLCGAAAACGPVPVDQAEEQCFTPALQARNPLTGTNIGVDGPTGELELTVTSDFVQGRDPAAVYNACVYRKSGQMPRQPLYARPDWRG